VPRLGAGHREQSSWQETGPRAAIGNLHGSLHRSLCRGERSQWLVHVIPDHAATVRTGAVVTFQGRMSALRTGMPSHGDRTSLSYPGSSLLTAHRGGSDAAMLSGRHGRRRRQAPPDWRSDPSGSLVIDEARGRRMSWRTALRRASSASNLACRSSRVFWASGIA
jgi:hypothetical protein